MRIYIRRAVGIAFLAAAVVASAQAQDVTQNLPSAAAGRDFFRARGLEVFVGGPANETGERRLDVYATFEGPAGTEFGYRDSAGGFVRQGDTTNSASNPALVTFSRSGRVDLAARRNGELFPLSSGMGKYSLSHPHPDHPGVFQTANVLFETSAGPAHLRLEVSGETPGGILPLLCTDALKGEFVLLVINKDVGYCVTAYGWSDSMFYRPFPPIYDQALDVLSGDNAINLRFSVDGQVVSGLGWLTLGMDAGTLVPFYSTGSPWIILTEVDYVEGFGTMRARSVIRHPVYLLDIAITTEVSDSTVSQTFHIVNNGEFVIEDPLFTVYSNFHPNGSLDEFRRGRIEYMGLEGMRTTGDAGHPSFVANSQVYSWSAADFWDVGVPGPPPSDGVIRRVEENNFNLGIQFGPGDVTGAQAWRLGNLNPTDTVSMTVWLSRVAAER